MSELGYFTLGFVSGIVFTFASLISVGRWMKKMTSAESLEHKVVQQPSPVKKQETMWN